MNSKIVIAVAVQFMLACAPLVGQAAALERDKNPDQLWNIDIDRELFQDCLKQRDSLRVKGNRMALPQDRVRINAKLQQGDLLHELLTPEVIRYGSIQMTEVAGKLQKNSHENNRQESWLLKEFTAETSIP